MRYMLAVIISFLVFLLHHTNSLTIPHGTDTAIDDTDSNLPYVIADPQFLKFKKHDQDTRWPLPQPDDVGCLIEHGLHCVEIVQGNSDVNITDDMEKDSPRMHVEHCGQVVHRVLRYFEANTDYSVPSIICEDLMTITHWSKRHMMRNKLIFLYWGYKKYSLFSEKDMKEMDQYQMYSRISGANFGDLLFKDWKGEGLTMREAEIIEKLNSDQATRFAALGVYCTHGGKEAKNFLLNLQKNSHDSMPYGS